MGKEGKKKSSQNDQPKTQPQPGNSDGATNTTSVFPPRNAGTGRPHVQCSACGGNNHLRKDCQQIIFVQNVGQGHMLHGCALYLPIQVKLIIFAYNVVAKTTLQVTVPVGPMITERKLDQHQGTSTILDHILKLILKIQEFHKEAHGTPKTRKHWKLRKILNHRTTGTYKEHFP